MNYITCLNPQTFTKNGQTLTVPCGKCFLCRNKSSLNWQRKLERECECWQFVQFVTLTYDDDHLPVVHYDNKTKSLIDMQTGELVDLTLSVKERAYCKKRKTLSYPRVRDFQLFIKRLRYYFYEYTKQNRQSSTLRYYLITEYGPTTHRIHAHLLVFFNDKRLEFASKFAYYVNKSWQNGNILCESVQKSNGAIKYVSKYVNVDYHKFSLFKTSFFRNKVLFSKNPPIGSLLDRKSDMLQIFKSAAPLYRHVVSNKFEDVPLPMYIKNRLFPKIPKFDRLDHIQRVGIYSIYKWSGTNSPEDFCEWIDKQIVPIFDYKTGTYVSMDFLNFKPNGEPLFDSSELLFIDYPRLPLLSYLHSLINNQLKDPFYTVKWIWRVSRRICAQAEVFGYSLSDYVKKIDKYYSNVQLLQLKNLYETQQEISTRTVNKHPVGSFVYLDTHFVNVFLSYNNIEDVPLWMIDTFWGYDINPFKFFSDSVYRKQFDPDYYPDVISFNHSIEYSYQATHKTKQKKEYIRKHNEFSYLKDYNL